MRTICLCFQVHYALRLRHYPFFDIDTDHYYYDDFQIEEQLNHLVYDTYLPANRLLLDMINSSNGKFKCAFAISGVILEQLEMYAPEVIDSFKELAKTGCVEFVAKPYAHSLASVYDQNEFETQVKLQVEKIESLFAVKPGVFGNTELIYSDQIGETISRMGYKTTLAEGDSRNLGWKSPNNLYMHAYDQKLKILTRNNKLSDDIALRFSDPSWDSYPLTADKYVGWISETLQENQVANIWLNYDALGTVHRAETGIFDFFRALPYFAMEHKLTFMTPSEVTKTLAPTDKLLASHPISWAGEEKDLSLWTGNDLQQEALYKLYQVTERVRLCSDEQLKRDWLCIQTVDHFRYMSHKDSWGSYYGSPYEAFINYMNILSDFLNRVDAQYPTTIENEELNELLKTINHQEREIERLEGELKKARSRKKAE